MEFSNGKIESTIQLRPPDRIIPGEDLPEGTHTAICEWDVPDEPEAQTVQFNSLQNLFVLQKAIQENKDYKLHYVENEGETLAPGVLRNAINKFMSIKTPIEELIFNGKSKYIL